MRHHGDIISNISHEVTRELLEGDSFGRSRNPSNYLPLHNEMSEQSQCTDETLRPTGRIQRHRSVQSSGTCTTMSREAWYEHDEIDDRAAFVEEYNRLAKKYGVRLFNANDHEIDSSSTSEKPGSWFSCMLRRTSSTHSTKLKIERQLSHKRSTSDISLKRASKTKHTLKDKTLQDLVRLCGLSLLYLPTDYAPCSLTVPTCFRSTAQYLVQHGPAVPGVFRIPGSNNVVAALYDHYCPRGEEGDIAGTVSCPTLPQHIKYDVHDVASTFKRFLAGVPGGILGSLALFNMLVSIQNQFHADPEIPAKKRDQIRSRLIALAIATLKSQYRRELICAVFGLLSLIGQAAESEYSAEQGAPLPISDLMGYGPLGIVFGPLLVGELLDDYNLRLPNPYGGLIVLPISPPKSRKEKQKERQNSSKSHHDNATFTTHVDKIKIVNSITEMLIVHWQEVVSFMKILQVLQVPGKNRELTIDGPKRQSLRPSASEAFPRDVQGHEVIGLLDPRDGSLATENAIFSPRRMRSKSQPLFKKTISVMRSAGRLTQNVEQASEVTVEPASLETPSDEVELQHPPLEEKPLYVPAPSSNQNTPRKVAARTHTVVPKSLGDERSQDRVLRLPRKKSTRSLPEQQDLSVEEGSSSVEPLSSTAISRATTPQVIEPNEWFGNVVSEPGFWLSDPGIPPTQPQGRSSPSTNSALSRLRARSSFASTAPKDALSKVSPQEDLASLAALAGVLSQDSECNTPVRSTRKNKRDKDKNGAKTISGGSVSRAKGGRRLSSSSILNPFLEKRSTISRKHGSSGSSSSPLSIFLSKRRRDTSKQRPPNMMPAKPVDSGISISEFSGLPPREDATADKSFNRSSLLPPTKSIGQHLDIDNPVRASPRGTVKALVAKFSLGMAPLPLAKPSGRPYSSTAKASQEVRKSSIVSPYTKNTPSLRSQRSGISDKTVMESRNPPKLDLFLQTPKKDSPFTAVTPREQSRSSANMDSPSIMLRKSLVGISTPSGDFLCRPSQQGNRQGREFLPYSSVKPSQPVKEVSATNSEVSNIDITHNNSVPTTTPKSLRKALAAERSTSELQEQIRTLQQQLAAKTEEAQQVRNQLAIQSEPDVGALGEDVLEAKREVQFWKSRAESYEKQIEAMKHASNLSSLETTPNRPTKALIQVNTRMTNGSDDIDPVVYRNRRALRNIDGASSWYSQDSVKNESTGTLYGFGSAVSSSENDTWLEQTMRALRRTES